MIKYLSHHKVILESTNKINHSQISIHMEPDTKAPKGSKGFYRFSIYKDSTPVSNLNKGLIIAVFDNKDGKMIDYDLNFNMYKVSKEENLDLIYAFKLLNDSFFNVIKHELLNQK